MNYICKYNNSCDEVPMSKSKLYAWLLSILGFQMQGCHNYDYEEIEYGCPYTFFGIAGTVTDENGNNIRRADVSMKIETVVSKPEHKEVIVDKMEISDDDGTFPIIKERCEDIDKYEKLKIEIITSKYGYKIDTLHKEIKKEDLKSEETDSWNKINIVLKKNK